MTESNKICAPDATILCRAIPRRLAALAQHGHHAAMHGAHKVLRVQDRVQRLHLEHVAPSEVLQHWGSGSGMPPDRACKHGV